ncbi:MAG: phage recombination protein Bet [Rhodocyclales bacterium]|nr:phage recombination protein Bet [Rhodocyclales bacterium]
MTSALVTLTSKLAQRLDMGDGTGLVDVLKATAFKGQVSDAQMTALMVVANQYGLNPWTKEIYAFPDKNNGIVPVVGVDGWSRIINEHPQFDGVEFEYGPATGNHFDWIECVLYRKDRSRPIRAREFFTEVYRDNAQPWKSHPNRMHRHKSLIQCSRIAFGFGGIYDQDEAERIIEGKEIDMGSADVVSTRAAKSAELPVYSNADFQKNLPAWTKLIQDGRAPERIIGKVNTTSRMTDQQIAALHALVPKAEAPAGELMASTAQIDIIKTTADAAAVGSSDIFNTFDIASYDEVTTAMVDPILDFIANPITE